MSAAGGKEHRCSVLTPQMCNQLVELFSRREVKNFIVEMLITNIWSVTDMMRSILRADPYYKPWLKRHAAFEWDMIHFQRRMDPQKYVDVLHLEHPQSITLTKLITDLDCLDYYLAMISTCQIERVLLHLSACQRLLFIREDLTVQYRLHSNISRALKYGDDHFGKEMRTKVRAKEEECVAALGRYIDLALVEDPVRVRYIKNNQLSHNDGLEHSFNDQERKVLEQIKYYKNAIQESEIAFRATMSHHNIQIEEYTTQISYWTWKYNQEYEDISNKVSYCKISTQALKKHMQDCKDRIVLFHEDIRQFRAAKQLKEEKQMKAVKEKAESELVHKPQAKKAIVKKLKLKKLKRK